LERSYFHTEEPISEPTIPALFHVSSIAYRDVKVVMSGQGADEPLAGYNRYRGEYFLNYYKNIIKLFPQSFFRSLHSKKEQIDQLFHAASFKDEFERYMLIYEIFNIAEKQKLFKENSINASELHFHQLFIDFYNRSRGLKDSLSRMLFLDLRTMLPDNLLLFNDKITMACSIENRVPFLDNDLIEFIESLPIKFKLRNGISKYLLKKVAQKYLPYQILNRKKRGFKTPFSEWLKNPQNTQFLDLINSTNSLSSQYFNKGYIENIYSKYQNGHLNYFKKLYAIFSLEMWYLNFYKKI
jgi:asparagine synthase (glutamine-hydrolysing)